VARGTTIRFRQRFVGGVGGLKKPAAKPQRGGALPSTHRECLWTRMTVILREKKAGAVVREPTGWFRRTSGPIGFGKVGAYRSMRLRGFALVAPLSCRPHLATHLCGPPWAEMPQSRLERPFTKTKRLRRSLLFLRRLGFCVKSDTGNVISLRNVLPSPSTSLRRAPHAASTMRLTTPSPILVVRTEASLSLPDETASTP